MASARFVLTQNKKIRGKEFKKGTVIFEGACVGDFTPADLGKAVQLKEVELEFEGPEKKPKKLKD